MHVAIRDPAGQSSSGAPARRTRTGGAAATALALAVAAGCGPVTRGPAPRTPMAPVAVVTPLGTTELRYQVDARRSEIRILAFRGGPLAFFGHNHVLVSRELAGEVELTADGSGGRFEVSFPVARLAIDEPAARREEGENFATEPSAEDIAGTRRNLLGPGVLDAADYAQVRVSGRYTGAGLPTSIEVRVEIRGQATVITVPVHVARDEPTLTASGSFTVEQSFLGLKPFSALSGALQVRDQLEVRFRIVAVSQPQG